MYLTRPSKESPVYYALVYTTLIRDDHTTFHILRSWDHANAYGPTGEEEKEKRATRRRRSECVCARVACRLYVRTSLLEISVISMTSEADIACRPQLSLSPPCDVSQLRGVNL